MDTDSIPLFDGDSSGSSIIHPHGEGVAAGETLRSRRACVRRACEHVLVCFSPRLTDGRIDQAECPAINVSARGFAIEYDAKLLKGTPAHLDYRTVSGRPVHVHCMVRRCRPLEGGRYLVGLDLARKLQFDEYKPSRRGIGREIAPGIRARKLLGLTSPPNPASDDEQADASKGLSVLQHSPEGRTLP